MFIMFIVYIKMKHISKYQIDMFDLNTYFNRKLCAFCLLNFTCNALDLEIVQINQCYVKNIMFISII